MKGACKLGGSTLWLFTSLEPGAGWKRVNPVSYSGAGGQQTAGRESVFVNKVEHSHACSITDRLSVAAFALPWQR